ncbi:MAG: DUF5615 family PIN-like protein [Proteobacteria bacterium]|nr:DUF5615 family PIN-like protein [Pseudomonadota bacterium]
MRILLDECIDWRLSRELVGHEVKTARQMGWASRKNGELLALAATAFDVFITVDRNLSFQQNPSAMPLSVVVLRCRSNRLADLKILVPGILEALRKLPERKATFIG